MTMSAKIRFDLLLLPLALACNQMAFTGASGQNVSGSSATAATPAGPESEEITLQINQTAGSSGKADIIFLLDTSDSMKEEKAKLELNMPVFLRALASEFRAVDFQIMMIGKDFVFPGSDGYRGEVIEQQVDSYDALTVLQDFLVSPNLRSMSLRVDAIKDVIIVSDDNARTNPREFEAWARENVATVGRVRINGIVGTDESRQTVECQIAAPGTTYRRLEESAAVGGFIQDICSNDWGPLLTGLAKRIVTSSVSTEVVLSKALRQGMQVQVTLNGQQLDPSHLSIDYGRNAIVLDGSIKTNVGDKVKVSYFSL